MPERPARWTVLELLNWTRHRLERAGVDSPRLAAEILLASVLRCRRIELYTRFDYVPTEEQLAPFRELIRQAAERRPIAYLVGEREFYSLAFRVTPDVLIPRPETEILVEQAVGVLRGLGRSATMWDACTGSGCVAAAVAKQVPDLRVLATDLSPAAVAVAASNVARHQLEPRVQVFEADLLTLPAEWTGGKTFDVITANPPYVPDAAEVSPEVAFEPSLALRGGKEGLDLLRRLIAAAPEFLAPGGALIVEFGIDQGPAVRRLLLDTGAFEEPRILLDHQELERAALARKNAG